MYINYFPHCLMPISVFSFGNVYMDFLLPSHLAQCSHIGLVLDFNYLYKAISYVSVLELAFSDFFFSYFLPLLFRSKFKCYLETLYNVPLPLLFSCHWICNYWLSSLFWALLQTSRFRNTTILFYFITISNYDFYLSWQDLCILFYATSFHIVKCPTT